MGCGHQAQPWVCGAFNRDVSSRRVYCRPLRSHCRHSVRQDRQGGRQPHVHDPKRAARLERTRSPPAQRSSRRHTTGSNPSTTQSEPRIDARRRVDPPADSDRGGDLKGLRNLPYAKVPLATIKARTKAAILIANQKTRWHPVPSAACCDSLRWLIRCWMPRHFSVADFPVAVPNQEEGVKRLERDL